MRNYFNARKTRQPLSEERKAVLAVARSDAKEQRLQEQLANVRDGIGWSSDKVLALYFDVSRQRIWVWAKEGKLPAPHKHGEATTRWNNSEVQQAEHENFLTGAV